jgi:inosine-uridine nucleoside N-ribohydrolase
VIRKSRLSILLVLLGALSCTAQTTFPVWIDTDPSVERGGHEVDDGFALVQAFHSPELEIQGVSIVFGNAPLSKAWQIGTEIVEKFGPKGLHVFRGAAGSDELGKETDASKALAECLAHGRVNILAIGPVTNVATALQRHPELAKNVIQIIAVAGRRPGQRFLSGPKQAHAFRDLNFELDPAAFQVLLDANVPIVVAPWEISFKVWITREDLERLDHLGGPGAKYLVPPALDWLNWWHDNLGADGFNPFDTLAVGYLTSPALYQCTKSKIRITDGPDDTGAETSARNKPFLIVSPNQDSSHTVTYCSNVNSQFKEDLLARLLRH